MCPILETTNRGQPDLRWGLPHTRPGRRVLHGASVATWGSVSDAQPDGCRVWTRCTSQSLVRALADGAVVHEAVVAAVHHLQWTAELPRQDAGLRAATRLLCQGSRRQAVQAAGACCGSAQVDSAGVNGSRHCSLGAPLPAMARQRLTI